MSTIRNDCRVRLIKDCIAINPAFDRRLPSGSENPKFRTLPAGTELHDPHAWMLCRPDAYFGDVKAEPLDEYTRDRVLADEQRAAAIIAERERRLQAESAAKATGKRRSR